MKPNWRSFLKKLLHLGISVCLTLVLLEIGSLILVETNRVPARVPSYRWPKAPRPFLADVNPHFGTWHVPNSQARHTMSCFDVVYESNSYGAIDRERDRKSNEGRTLVIGDSFVEGFGVDRADRFTDQLERETGIPHLNFGTSGNFGPTQYYLCYQHLAMDFDHDTVIVAILPDNDFRNDKPKPDRYRPYWDGEYPDYTLRYSTDRLEDSSWSVENVEVESSIKRYLRNFSYAFNCAEWVETYLDYRSSLPQSEPETLGAWSGYYDCTDRELLRLGYSLEKIREAADGKRLVVFSIPRLNELLRFDAAEGTRFGSAMEGMATQIGFEYIDLLPLMHERYEGQWSDLFLECDDHWSPFGHDAATAILQEALYGEN